MIKIESKEKLKKDLDEVRASLNSTLESSFKYIQQNPGDKKDTLEIWKSFLKSMTKQVYHLSEKYDQKDIIKSVTKTIMFGR
mgnify:CR=1 FL=1